MIKQISNNIDKEIKCTSKVYKVRISVDKGKLPAVIWSG